MEKRKSKSFGFVMLLLIIGGGYIHGVRLADLSEVPSSGRPWKVLVNGSMG